MRTRILITSVLLLFAVKGWGQETNNINNKTSATNTIAKTTDIKKQEKPKKQDSTESLVSKLMFLNAYNFDFSNKLNSNYVLHLNLFAPDLDKTKRWGFNVGIMRIDYSLSDSLANKSSHQQVDYVRKFSFDRIKPGDIYYRQLNEYNITTKNSSFSVYVQPLFQLTNPEADQKIYLHSHFELYNSKFTTEISVNTIASDSLVYSTGDRAVIRNGSIDKNITQRSSLLTGYFGLGATFYFKDSTEHWAFFAQPTFGVSIAEQRFDISQFGYLDRRISQAFYLVRAYLSHSVQGKTTSIIVGTDIRGFLPRYSPQWAVYAGINLGVEEVFNLFGK
jgi:hypothetical protein